MYQYRQIIFRLRQGETVRGIARAKLDDRKKIRPIRNIAVAQGWLSHGCDLPTDEELMLFFKPQRMSQISIAAQHKAQIEIWGMRPSGFW